MDLPADSKSFTKNQRKQLSDPLDETDASFPENDSIESSVTGLIIRKPHKESESVNTTLIGQATTASMREISILDLLTEEQWLDLHALFGLPPRSDAKVDVPRKRFISTLFCDGCKLGPTRTVRR